MHRDKLPPDVTTLLSKCKLLLPEFEDRLMVVERRTSNLILAHIATDIAERARDGAPQPTVMSNSILRASAG